MPHFFYKHTKKIHLKDLSFRVGTLFDFRASDEKSGIGDKDEGIHAVVAEDIYFDSNDLDSDPALTKHLRPFIGDKVAKDVKIIGIDFIQREESQDFYVYSLSTKFVLRLMDEIGNDVCFKIKKTKIYDFIHDLSRELYKATHGNIKKAFLAKIKYGERRSSYKQPEKTHPALIKERKHVYQSEWRIIWEPINRPIKPELLKVSPLPSYIEIL